MRKKKYKYRDNKVLGKSYFSEYLPKDIFESLKKDEKKNYREYRRWYYWVGDSQSRIEKNKLQIQKLKDKISELKEVERDRKDKLNFFYSKVNHLMDKFSFTTTITLRDKTSTSYKVNREVREGKRESLEGFYGQPKKGWKTRELRSQYGGKKLIQRKKIYCIIVSKGGTYRKSIYVGSEVDVRTFLTEVVYKEYGRDIMKDSLDFVKDEIREIYKDYVRHIVSKDGWENLVGTSSHNLKIVSEWYKKTNNVMNDDVSIDY